MDIITKPLKWAAALYPFTEPVRYLVLHHEAGNGTLEQVHAYHQSLGWSGIAYHLYVRKDGAIYAGRPMDRKGGHCKDYNGNSIGICFEGNFENDRMGDKQKAAGAEAVKYALALYPQMKIVGHRELAATACPGAHFPLEEFKKISPTPAAEEISQNETGEDFQMTGEDVLDRLTDEQCYRILEKAQAHAAALPPPDWALDELEEARARGVTDGTRPMALPTRAEAAIMALRTMRK